MTRKINTDPISELPIRMPVEIKRWLEERARQTRSTQNSEVVRLLRAAMLEDQRAAG